MKTLGLLLGTLGFIIPLKDSQPKFEPKYYNNFNFPELVAIKEEETKIPLPLFTGYNSFKQKEKKKYSPSKERKYYRNQIY